MDNESVDIRKDTATKIIKASAEDIYNAFLDADAVAKWRPPEGMCCHIYSFHPREGGIYHMAFEYTNTGHKSKGKTSTNADVFTGQFVQLEKNKKIVESVTFESDDPAYTKAMIITTTLIPVDGGTEVTFTVTHVPAVIKPEDHYKGMMSTLDNLAVYTE
jgi:uncharacterized protein YndB with AHSA1/START domain